MNRAGLVFFGSMLCASVIILPARSEDSQSVIGTWQLNDYSQQFLDAKEVTRLFDSNPNGYIQYSPVGHMVAFLMSGDVNRPAANTYTDEERVMFQKSIVGAYAGTYSVEGDKIVHHILTSWRPEWIGSNQVRYFEINGKSLVIKTTPIKFSRTGQDMISTLTFERAE